MMRRNRREKGASAVEFALAMPILFVLMFGSVEFGLGLWRKQLLTSAVREGARAGIVATSPRKDWIKVSEILDNYMDGVGLTDTARTKSWNGPCAAAGDPLTVNATYPTSMSILSNLTAIFWGSSAVAASKTITATISMQCE